MAMDNLLGLPIVALIVIPFILTIIGLFIEYGFFARDKRTDDYSPTITRDWSTATKKAIDHFRVYRSLLRNERIIVEETRISRGQATLILTITPKWSQLFEVSGFSMILSFLNILPPVIARYELKIDRTGDILGHEEKLVSAGERQIIPASDRIEQNSNPILVLVSFTIMIACMYWFLNEATFFPLVVAISSTIIFIASLPLANYLKVILIIWFLFSELVLGTLFIQTYNQNYYNSFRLVELLEYWRDGEELTRDDELSLEAPAPSNIPTTTISPTSEINHTQPTIIPTLPSVPTPTLIPQSTHQSTDDVFCMLNNGFFDRRTINVNETSGDVSIYLAGTCAELSTIDINTTSADINLDLEGVFPNLVSIRISSTSSDMNINLTGTFLNLNMIIINSTSGIKHLNLAGDWAVNTNINLQTSSGDLILWLPEANKVELAFSTTFGDLINSQGFIQENGVYYYSSAGESAVQMNIMINSTSGDLEIR